MAKYISIETQYRDADNYKSWGQTYFINDTSLTAKEVKEIIIATVKLEEPLMADDHYLNNHAPVTNEYHVADNDHDHCFIEICDALDQDLISGTDELNPLSLFIDSLRNPSFHSRELIRKTDHAINLVSQLSQLTVGH